MALQARLRGANGCPWDRKQTHQSLRTYLVEEVYEVLEALDGGNEEKIASELGDLLLQIVFHAELGREAGRFDIGEVIERIHTKMVQQHPHVFGNVKANTAAQVLKHWEQLKADERRAGDDAKASSDAAPASILEGVPRTLPALLEAHQLTRRASNVGFDWEDIEGLLEKLNEEVAELRENLKQPGVGAQQAAPSASNEGSLRESGQQFQIEEEAGDLLFVAVNVARFLGLDPEIALKKANRKFAARFREMEQQAAQQGRRLANLSKDELEALWEASKGRGVQAQSRTGAPACPPMVAPSKSSGQS